MKNKIKLKKMLFKFILISILIFLISSSITIIEYKIYTNNFNAKVSGIVEKVIEEYPNISENELMSIINTKNTSNKLLKKYNIDIDKDTIVLENKKSFQIFIVINSLFLLISIAILLFIFLKFNNNKDKEINEITKYIEEINKKNYKLNIDEISEDELSILKNEIYKTTVMLKEQAENSNKDKIDLKSSLSDISHQLKTPLTSILIILDNLLEDEDMDEYSRQDFIFDIKREINNINFLVQSLLKLSKLDTNTVKFINKDVSVRYIINESIKKLSCVSDLKNIKINMNFKSDIVLKVDKNWQIEAFSNILKNCIEHSKDNGNIDIELKNNKIYSKIVIKDYGIGIDKNDLPHIFERFYKGKNSSSESIGIGLALAKSIIEQSNGQIKVESELGKGTTFTIKYFKI